MAREVTFTSDRRRLAGTLFEPENGIEPGPSVLFIHGLNSSRKSYATRARRLVDEIEATCLTFDLGGHGESDGALDALAPSDLLTDVCSAYDLLISETSVDSSRIGLSGASYGGYLATLTTPLRPVKRMVLRAPALYDDTLFDRPMGDWPTRRPVKNVSRMTDALRSFSGAVLVLESEFDEVISHATIEEYVAACRHGRHELIPGAKHALTIPRWDEAFVEHLLDWFGGL